MKFRILPVLVMLVFGQVAFAEQSLREMAPKSSPPEYYAEFYSFQNQTDIDAKPHPFVHFLKMQNGITKEIVDVSWLKKGSSWRNYSMGDTFALAGQYRVSSQGQFPVSPELFDAARVSKKLLESGQLHATAEEAVRGILNNLRTAKKQGELHQEPVVASFLASGQMGPQWRAGVLSTASGLQTTAHSSRPELSETTAPQPLTHSTKGVTIYPAGIGFGFPARPAGSPFRRTH